MHLYRPRLDQPIAVAATLALLALAPACGTTMATNGTGDGPAGTDASASPTDASAFPTDGPASTPDLAMNATCFPATTMLDLSNAPGAGGAYPKPALSWKCTASTFQMTTNGIPPYTFVQTTPNALAARTVTHEITLNPAPAAKTTALPGGYVGFAVNGLTFYSPAEGAQPANQIYGDPVYNGLLDGCMGHTSPSDYHYHAYLEKCMIASSLVAKPWMNADPDATKPSPVLGWAADGYPVYGPRECTDNACSKIAIMQSGYTKIGDPTTYATKAYQFAAHAGDNTYMDECNGHIGPKGDYHYHSTTNYPYITNCFHGTPMGIGGGMMMGGGPDGGMGGMPDGGMMMGGMPDGGMGPKSCTQAADCNGACPMGSKGCTCAKGMMGGMICVPTCTVAADCPPGPMGMVFKCNNGVCGP